MSTKTNFKRVALVAVAALGLGVLTSVAPASAADRAVTFAAAGTGTSIGVCGVTSTGAVMALGGKLQGTIGAAADTLTTDSVQTSGVITVSAGTTNTTVNSLNKASITAATSAGVVTFAPTAIGTGTIKLYASTTLVATYNVSVVAACDSAASAAYSTIQVSDVSTGFYQVDTTTATGLAASSTAFGSVNILLATNVDQKTTFANGSAGNINVYARDSYGNSMTTGVWTVSAPGALVEGYPTTYSKAVTGSNAYQTFAISQPTANAGVTTAATISYNGVVIATKNIVIQGEAAKLTATLATSGESGLSAGDAKVTSSVGDSQNLVSYRLTDSAGNQLTDSSSVNTVSLYSSDNPGLVNTALNARYNAETATPTKSGLFTYNCINAAKSGSAKLVFSVTNKSGVTIKSDPVEVTCSGSTYTYTASLDKATYKGGDIATLTIKALDGNGKAVHDYTELGNGAKSSVALPGMTAVTAPVSTDLSIGGIWEYTYTVNNDASGGYAGAVSIGGAAVQTTPATVQYTVTAGNGVSNADVLKAIVSLIASINKQIAALQKALLKK